MKGVEQAALNKMTVCSDATLIAAAVAHPLRVSIPAPNANRSVTVGGARRYWVSIGLGFAFLHS